MESELACALSAFGALSTRSVPHILENISFSLDYKSFKTCMKVNKAWRDLLSSASYQKRLAELLIEKETNEKKLYDASQKGNAEAVRRLINNHMVDVNMVVRQYSSWHQSTPLMEAARNGHKEVVNILLQAGALVDKANNQGMSSLHLAAYHDHNSIVKLLLDAGSKIGKASITGLTPLMLAAASDRKEVFKLLPDGRAGVDKAGNNGITPLIVAARSGQLDIVQILLNAGSDIDKADTK